MSANAIGLSPEFVQRGTGSHATFPVSYSHCCQLLFCGYVNAASVAMGMISRSLAVVISSRILVVVFDLDRVKKEKDSDKPAPMESESVDDGLYNDLL